MVGEPDSGAAFDVAFITSGTTNHSATPDGTYNMDQLVNVKKRGTREADLQHIRGGIRRQKVRDL